MARVEAGVVLAVAVLAYKVGDHVPLYANKVFVGSYYLRHERPGPSSAAEMPRGIEGPLLAAELLRMDSESMLDMIFRVWLEMMWYAADHCSRDSHARQLNNGGEFLTVVWLLIEHVRLSPRERETADG